MGAVQLSDDAVLLYEMVAVQLYDMVAAELYDM